MPQTQHGVGLLDDLVRARDLAREGRAAEVRMLADRLDRSGQPVELDDRVLLGTLLGQAHANAQEFEAARAALDAVLPLVPAACPLRQARFHAVAAWTAHGRGDDEAAMDDIVRSLTMVEDPSLPGGEDLRAALGNCSLVLALLQLFPLAAETAERSVQVAAANELAGGAMSALFDGWAAAWRAICSARLGDIEQGLADLELARSLPVSPPNPSVRDFIDLAAGALLLAEGQIQAAESTLLGLWTRLDRPWRSPFVEEVASLLGQAAAARGDGAAALRWYREMHERYGRAQYGAWLARATAARLRIEQEALLRRTRELESDALSDPLTRVPNRRAFDADLPRLVAAAQASGTPLTLAIVDVDRFKRVNDTFGHPAGDEVLRQLATILRSRCPEADRCARYGGDEFTLCLPMPAGDAFATLDRVARLIAEHQWSAVAPGLAVTVSVGVAELGPGDTPATLFWSADQSLLAAKRTRTPAPA